MSGAKRSEAERVSERTSAAERTSERTSGPFFTVPFRTNLFHCASSNNPDRPPFASPDCRCSLLLAAATFVSFKNFLGVTFFIFLVFCLDTWKNFPWGIGANRMCLRQSPSPRCSFVLQSTSFFIRTPTCESISIFSTASLC